MFKPLVSIIMPAFNVERYVSESIESVISQTFQDWELIIIDDCSTDRTFEIASNFAKGDERIQALMNELNFGGAQTRNKGIEVAKGKYIAFLDSDDLWLPNKLAEQIAFMEERSLSFSYSSYLNIDAEGKILSRVSVPPKVSFNSMVYHNYIGCLTAIYDQSKLGKVFFPNIKKRQDFALWLTLLKRVPYAYGMPEPLAKYRNGTGTLSANKLSALKYYRTVLRDVGELSSVNSIFCTTVYFLIVSFKKLLPSFFSYVVRKF